MVDSSKYVVLDVETNGLSSLRDDLLSISIYKPDDKKIYDRFLPLELDDWVWTTRYNGITRDKLRNKKPLSQEEFDKIIADFELEKRTILTYSSLDEKFIKNYVKRKKLHGFEKLTFYDFKKDIISSSFSRGIITKDNLCRFFDIKNVTDIHSGLNDCLLEWNLFEALDGKKLIIFGLDVFEYNPEYIVPVSYLQTFHNFKYCINSLPRIKYEAIPIKTIEIKSDKLKKFNTNINGISIEHRINSLLNVESQSAFNAPFLINNKAKLKKLGTLPVSSPYREIPVTLENNGKIAAFKKEDSSFVNEVNDTVDYIENKIQPLIKYIKNNIFQNKTINSQELVVNYEHNVLAICDLSDDKTILEIKTNSCDINNYKYQLYYSANGREIFYLSMDWDIEENQRVVFTLSHVKKIPPKDPNIELEFRKNRFEKSLNNPSIKVINYKNYKSPVTLKCTICGSVWTSSYYSIKRNCNCKNCSNETLLSIP